MREAKNTQSKKNARSALIVGLLLLLVAVIGFGGYTLSKYVTSKNNSGSANVAKWGFTVEADANGLFGKNYKFDTNESVVTEDTASLTVSASDSKAKVVAPGTTGSMTFSIAGSAEVLSQVKVEMVVASDVALKYTANGAAAETYNPVKWTLKKDGVAVTGAENVTLATIASKLNSVETCAPNATAKAAGEYTLSWAWDFDANGTGTNDALDTLLGMYAANNAATTNGDYAVVADGTSTTVAFTLNVSVTQLKEAA